MSLFVRKEPNLCWLTFALIIYWRVVAWVYKAKSCASKESKFRQNFGLSFCAQIFAWGDLNAMMRQPAHFKNIKQHVFTCTSDQKHKKDARRKTWQNFQNYQFQWQAWGSSNLSVSVYIHFLNHKRRKKRLGTSYNNPFEAGKNWKLNIVKIGSIWGATSKSRK